MKRTFYSIVLLFTFSLLFGQSSFKGIPINNTSPALDIQFSDYQIVEFDVDAIYHHIKQRSTESRFRLRVGTMYDWEVGITPYDIRQEDYQLVIQSERGRLIAPHSENKTYRGQSYPQGGDVRFTIDRDFLYGFITEGDQVFYIEPAWTYDATLGKNHYLVYNASNVLDLGHTCGTDHNHNFQEEIPTAPEAARMMMNCYQVPIALAADFSIFSVFGSTTNTENFMVGVLNNVQTNYDDEFNDQIEFSVAGFFISTCSTCDPWTTSNDAGTLLNSFANWGNGGGFGFSYSLASLWTNRNFTGPTIGVAWVGGLCTNLRYNTVQRFTTNAANLRVLQAHEFGHNFNALHDGSGAPFIMAPSVNTSTQWSTASQNTINSFIASKANQPGCFFACASSAPPEAIIVAPVTHVCPGSVVPFIDGSLNNPTSWQWDFAGGQPSASTLQNPLVIYPNEGIFTVVLSVDNAQGSDLTVLNTDILVDQDGTKYMMYETFENGLGFWTTLNPDNSTTWQSAEVGGTQYGRRAAFMDNFNYNAEGQIDALISPSLDFSAESDLTFQMDYAYRRYNSSFSDQLRISLSTNGGTSYPFELFFGQETGGGNFATSFDQTSSFAPSAPSDWCYSGAFGPGCITLDLSDYAGESNVKIKIENINDFGNNMYVDNVRITGNCQPTVPPLASFFSDVTDGCAPLSVQFEDVSFGTVDNWEWSFPGGTPSTSFEQNPTVVYNQPGIYEVSLIVYNTAGSDEISLPGYIIVDGPPVPDFLIDIEDFTASFTDLSVDATSASWTFGDGSTSTDPSPSHTYDEEGDYIVTLYVSNDCGTDSLSQTITIESPITAGFKADTLQGCPGLVVSYMDTTIGNVINWEWLFEGGNPATDTVQNPVVIYNTPGLFTTTLVVTNDLGSTDTLVQTSYIQINNLAEAAFTYQYTLGDTSVSFDNASQYADTYYWDFGDGDTSNMVNPITTYSADGNYTVLLIASSECGSDTTSQVITIVTPPTANFDLSTTNGCVPFTINPVNTSSTNVDSLVWLAPGAMPDTSFVSTPSFTYQTEGVFTLSLIVINEAGSDTTSTQITVNDLPIAAFSVDYSIGDTSANFTTESTNAGTYEWWFGDGDTSTEENPSHTYMADGLYTITHIAFNECGSDTTSADLEIITPPTAAFNLDPTEGCAPFTANPIDASSSNTDSWEWTALGAMPEMSTDQAPSFSYQNEGNYTITLIVNNEAGSDTTTMDIIVDGLPTADLSYDYSIGETSVAFTTQSSNADTYEWWFGDGDVSAEENPSHTYMADGLYTVTHIAFNDCGSDTTSTELEIITSTMAAFSLSATEGCTPFTASPVDASSSNTDSWEWSAPGAVPDMSTDQAPEFNYNTPGTYTITLITTNEAGSDTSSLEITLGEGPIADFTIDYTLGNDIASFNNLSSNANDYEWWFGDGDTSTDEDPSHTYLADGLYTITHIAFNDCGADTTSTELEIITLPTAAFSLSATEGCTPFTASPVDASSSNTDSWEWSAPGAMPETSTDQAPDFNYDNPGTFTITLITTNEAGSDTSSVEITLGEGPIAEFAMDYTIGSNMASFNNQSSNANSYEWWFGDGEISTEENPSYIYEEDETYTVTLIVFNDCGSDTTTMEVEIITPPTATFSIETNEGCTPFIISPTDDSSENTEDWQWIALGADPEMSNNDAPSFTYNTAGIYTLTLITSNAAGSDTSSIDINLGEGPQADFTYDYTLGTTVVDFNNQSSNADSYEWHFGDGNISTDESPTHDYMDDNTYTITLISFNDCGPDTSITEVKVVTAPTAAFSLDEAEGCASFTVNPIDASSENTDDWQWIAPGAMPEMADGSSPSFTYETAGDYTITLITENQVDSDTTMMMLTVGTIPLATFDIDYTIGNTAASFTAQSNTANTYEWWFGDGNISMDENPSNTYAEDGVYTVTFIAFNDCGADTISQHLEIITVPTAAFQLDNTTGCAPFTINPVDASSANTDTWEWIATGATPETAEGNAPSFTYEEEGTYTLTLISTNEAGSDSFSMEITVNGPPSPAFDFQINGVDITFTNNSVDADSYSWDFGDENGSIEEAPSYTYDALGNYIITLSTTNECGTTVATDSVSISMDMPIAAFSTQNNTGCAPLEVSFINSSINASSYEWTFDGGTPTTSTEENPVIIFEESGIYSVTLLVTNLAGSGALTQMDLVVVTPEPTSGFTYMVDGPTVDFTSEAQDATEYLWLFGNGETSDLENPTYTYTSGTSYPVSLIAINACGVDTFTQEVMIQGSAPTPIVNASDSIGCAPFTVNFFGSTTGIIADSYDWIFEGGMPATSTEQNPAVVYEEAGTYPVSLTTANGFGSETTEQVDYITVFASPEASILFEYNTAFEIGFTSSATGGGLTYDWDFGDGNGSNMPNPVHTYEAEGVYTVSLTVSNQCGQISVLNEVVILTGANVDESWLEQLTIFPNPNQGVFTLEIAAAASPSIQAHLLNIVGQSVYSVQENFISGYWRHSFQLSSLPAGVYVLEVSIGERKAYRRVVIE